MRVQKDVSGGMEVWSISTVLEEVTILKVQTNPSKQLSFQSYPFLSYLFSFRLPSSNRSAHIPSPSLQQQHIMKQSKSQLQYNDCIFCDQQDGDNLFFMMNDALKVKYSQNPKDLSTSYIDCILRLQPPTNKQQANAACKYREYLTIDDHDEFLKREYEISEFGGKITQLSEYYKFHSDVPKVIQLGVQKIMGRYYDKKRECDYKRIKKVLKAEQGLSISSVQQSQSGVSDSQIVKKSRYSTLLNGISQNNINEMSDSNLLFDLCKQIDKAIPQSEYNFKGAFPEEKMFQYYLKAEEQKLKEKLKERNKLRVAGKVLAKKFNYQEFLKSREKITDESKETKPARQEKKQEKDSKFVYNTNIKIEIRNAMFYSQGQPNALHLGAIEYDNNRNDNRFKKKTIIGSSSGSNLKQYRSNQKLAAEIYKSSQHDLRLKNQAIINNQRLPTKENINQSRSKEKRRSNSKQLQPDHKKSLHAHSARKLLFNNNEWVLSRQPARSLSTSSIKRRSTSVHTGTATASTSTKKLQKGLLERRPVQTISRYGSSQYKQGIGLSHHDTKTVSIKELLSRKLKFKIQ